MIFFLIVSATELICVLCLLTVCSCPQAVAEQIPQLVQGVRGSQSQPDSPSAQLALISASQNFLQVLFTAPFHYGLTRRQLGWSLSH